MRDNLQQASLAARLENGQLIALPQCPFPLPDPTDLDFLRQQKIRHGWMPSIQWDPNTNRLEGNKPVGVNETERLARILRDFSDYATGWLANQLPEYSGHWQRDRACLRTEQELSRPARTNDCLHIDSFSDRPTQGRRLLRIFVNCDQEEPRVLQTSELFPELLLRFQARHRVPLRSATEWREPLSGLQKLIHGDWSGRPAYDSFMLNLKQYLKSDDLFQERAPRTLWTFPPQSTWFFYTDVLSHAVLRGRYLLEHSYLVPLDSLVEPAMAPINYLIMAGQQQRMKRAG